MPDEITWTVSGPKGDMEVKSKLPQLKYRDEVEITEDMSKGSKTFAEQYNEMRQRLLDLGEMKKK